MSFANLKRNSGSSLEKLAKAAESMSSGGNQNSDADEYWKCNVDKVGNGYAIIRFLPTPEQDGDDGLPFVKYWDHGFQGPGGWYIQTSLTSIGLNDPVSDYNGKLWATGNESDKELARKQKRRLHYVSNIYVVKDSSNPENEGKVFKFRYGKKIFEKITGAMNPQFEDEVAFDPFDLWTGANFKLKIRKVDGYQNYDLSEFDKPSPLSQSDEELELIYNSQSSLKEILDPKNFKSYEELERLLNKALGNAPTKQASPQENKMKNIETKEKEIENAFTDTLDDDENADFFADLLNDDD
jgi:hypothetical protein